jgi:hypothetical protein
MSLDRTAAKGQPEQDSWGQDNKDRKTRKGELGQESQRRQTGYYSQDRKQKQNGQKMTAKTGQGGYVT